MKRIFLIFTVFLLCFSCRKNEYGFEKRGYSSLISGEGFRSLSDFVYDELTENFFPEKVFSGAKVFVKSDYLDDFFLKFYPKISHKFILITHNSDESVPGKYLNFLNDDKLIAWFGQNPDCTHEKFTPIPIGFANSQWPHGNKEMLFKLYRKKSWKRNLLYMNFQPNTFFSERFHVYKLFKKKIYCINRKNLTPKKYLQDLKKMKFTLSPRGHGLDCHRTYEALLMGSIPIVKHSFLDPIFEGMPVLIIDRWEELNPKLLKAKYREMKNLVSKEKLFMDYWMKKINEKVPD